MLLLLEARTYPEGMLTLLDAPKGETKGARCLVECTSLKVDVEQKWYFDSGNSKHMTCNKEFFTNLQPCNLEYVTFGDGAKGSMIGSGLLKALGMPKLENVLLMNEIKVNIISISQLCDQNLFVKFTKDILNH